jgi:hypothetical protein
MQGFPPALPSLDYRTNESMQEGRRDKSVDVYPRADERRLLLLTKRLRGFFEKRTRTLDRSTKIERTPAICAQ